MMLTVWAELTDWHHFLTPLLPHIFLICASLIQSGSYRHSRK